MPVHSMPSSRGWITHRLGNLIRPLGEHWRAYLAQPLMARLDALERAIQALPPSAPAPAAPPSPVAPKPTINVNELVHNSRSAFLRQMPPGADVMCSAGCAGNWYFDWIEKCYGPVRSHIGVEYYSPKPESLPANVTWIANTVSNMSGVSDQSCDLVFSGQNLEHLWPEEVVGFLLESWRILRPDGHLVIDSPNREITAPLRWSHPEHTVEVTVPEIKKLVSLAGFDVVSARGIWLCRDPRTGRTLPFDPNVQDEWSLYERLMTATSDPENAFIWWVEARRSARQPDAEAVRAEMAAIFAKAWPERVQRFLVGAGKAEQRAGDEWVACSKEQPGAAIFGPYFPLRAGRYAVTFDVATGGVLDIGRDVPFACCEVMIGARAEPIASRDVRLSDIEVSPRVTLEFELAQLEFGVQFRCVNYGKIAMACRRGVTLVEPKHAA
jgi:SAM-dependent methyltransferase